MSIFKSIIKRTLLIFSGVCVLYICEAQTPTYTIDPNFNTGELFRDSWPVFDIYIVGDGRYLVGGGFSNFGVSPVSGFGMIFSDGGLDQNWGFEYEPTVLEIVKQEDGFVYPYIQAFSKVTLDGNPWVIETGGPFGEYNIGFANSPYNVERVWDIYQLENDDLLIGGAIASDTLQPNIFRGITRIHADGSHDSTFPILNITPNNASGAVRVIFPAPDGSWYISGSFTAINGHETNHVAKLNSNYEVDPTFVSPFMYDGPVNYTEDIILVDDQSRVWVSGYNMRLQANPNDTIQLCRLMPNGVIDTDFPLAKLKSSYPVEWNWGAKPTHAVMAKELVAHPGNYIINGSFSHYNDTLQPCIAVVNYDGIIQSNFFQGEGATVNIPYENDDDIQHPGVYDIEQLDNGDLLIGGHFTQFMGQTHYSVVKLKPGFVGVEDSQNNGGVNVYPNPTNTVFTISLENRKSGRVNIIDLSGKVLETQQMLSGNLIVDISAYPKGMYFLRIALEDKVVLRKLVVN